jgi:hypothetical protein
MDQVARYRKQAEECRIYARRERNPEIRALHLQIAQHWEEMAAEMERQSRPKDSR